MLANIAAERLEALDAIAAWRLDDRPRHWPKAKTRRDAGGSLLDGFGSGLRRRFSNYWQRIFWLLMVTIVPGLQVGAFILLTGPAGLNGAVAIAPAVPTAPPTTAPVVRAAPATGPPRTEVSCGAARFIDFFAPAASAGETEIAAMTAQQVMSFAFMFVPSDKKRPTSLLGGMFLAAAGGVAELRGVSRRASTKENAIPGCRPIGERPQGFKMAVGCRGASWPDYDRSDDTKSLVADEPPS